MKLSRAKARFDIPNDLLPLEGFTHQLDDLYVRMLQLEDVHTTWLLVSIDMTSLKDKLIDEIKSYLSEACHLAPEQIWVSVSHSFSVPHISDDLSQATEKSQKSKVLFESLMSAVQIATCELLKETTEVTVTHVSGNTHLGINRDLKTADGWWLGPNPNGQVADKIDSLVFTDRFSQVQARLMTVSVPSSITQDVNKTIGKPISGDLFGRTAQLLEEDGSLCLLLLGQAADQMPKTKSVFETLDGQGNLIQKDFSDQAEERLQLASEELASQMRRLDKHSRPLASDITLATYTLECKSQVIPSLSELKPDVAYQYQVLDEKIKLPISLLRLGKLTLIGLQVEVPARFLKDLALEEERVLVATMVNGGAKYLVPSSSYEERRYQAMNAFYAQGTYEDLVKTIQTILMKGDGTK